jgi:hypothetical protein
MFNSLSPTNRQFHNERDQAMTTLDQDYWLNCTDFELLTSKPIRETLPYTWYKIPGAPKFAPELLVIRIPEKFVGDDSFMVIPTENDTERQWLERALDRPAEILPTLFGPIIQLPTHELFVKKSMLRELRETKFLVYDRPNPDWPWIFVIIMPRRDGMLINEQSVRGRYLWSFNFSATELHADITGTLAEAGIRLEPILSHSRRSPKEG